MSSVLKALRQQQSKLIPQQQAIELAPAHQQARAASRWWLWLMVPAAAVIGWFAVGLVLPPAPPVGTPEMPAEAANHWQFGAPTAIRQVVLPLPYEDNERTVASRDEQPLPTVKTPPEPAPVNERGVDLEQVPADLLAAFDQAVAATGGGRETPDDNSIIPQLSALSVQLQRQVPSFSYDAHQYSSRANSRFVTLAGQRLWQGDQWQGIQVLTIAPNHVVLAFGNTAFRQPALQDWTSP